jgi:hypothetical protein
MARRTTVPAIDGSWPEFWLPGTRIGAYVGDVDDRRFLLLIFALSALSVVLLSIALFSH